jgi:hypothetical protein
VLSLSAETAQFRQDLQKANALAGEHAQTMQKVFDSAKTAIQGAISGGMVLYVKGLIDMAEETNKLSARTGHAVEFLSELRIAAAASNVDVGELTSALGRFNVSLQDARAEGSKMQGVMRALGVDVTRGPTEALRQFLANANALDDAAMKTAVFREAMGRTGDALIPLAGNFEQVMTQARKMGGTLKSDVAGNAERFNDAINILGTVGKTVMTNTLAPMVKTFADMAENILKAAERGEKWLQILREAGKLTGAAIGGAGQELSGVPGLRVFGNFLDASGSQVFDMASVTPTARGLPGWGDAAAAMAKAPNAGAVGDALNPEEVKRRQAELKKLAEERKKEINELLKKGVKSEEEAADARFKIAEQLYYDMGQLAKKEFDARMELYKQADESLLAGIVARTDVLNDEAIAKGREKIEQDKAVQKDADEQRARQLKVIEAESRKGEQAARDLGLTFASGFENAVIQGGRLRAVLDGIGQDIARIVARKTITEPLAGAFSGMFGGLFSRGGVDPGSAAPMAVQMGYDMSLAGFAGGGSFMVGGSGGTDSQFVGFRASPDETVTVETPAQRGRGGMVYSPTINVDARGADVGVAQRIRGDFAALLHENAKQIEAIVDRGRTHRGRSAVYA